jgi:hypothetical protein
MRLPAALTKTAMIETPYHHIKGAFGAERGLWFRGPPDVDCARTHCLPQILA